MTGRLAHIVFETCTCDCKTLWRKEDMILYDLKSDMCMISSPSSQNSEFDGWVSFSCVNQIVGIIPRRLVE